MLTGILIVVGVVVAILILVALWGVGIYNGLVTLRQAVKNAWAQIDVQLKRRHDLIPNLVETVKGYATHEKETLERVIAARARATSAATPADKIKAEGEVSSALARLLVVSEAYPDLKANTNFTSLQGELAGTEDRIAFAREAYNDAVSRLNTGIEVFPAVLIAGMLGFKAEPFFETPQAEREAPKVKF
jgi:LemA protein